MAQVVRAVRVQWDLVMVNPQVLGLVVLVVLGEQAVAQMQGLVDLVDLVETEEMEEQ